MYGFLVLSLYDLIYQGVPPRGPFGSLSIQHWRMGDPSTPNTIFYYFIIFILSFSLLVLCSIFSAITKSICLHIQSQYLI